MYRWDPRMPRDASGFGRSGATSTWAKHQNSYEEEAIVASLVLAFSIGILSAIIPATKCRAAQRGSAKKRITRRNSGKRVVIRIYPRYRGSVYGFAAGPFTL